MELLDWMKGKEMMAVVLLLVVGMTLYGHSRGLVRMLVSAASILISLVVVNLLLPFAETYLSGSGFLQHAIANWSADLFRENAPVDYSPIYKILGLDMLADHAGSYLAGIFIKIFCFAVLFLIINCFMKVLAHVLNLVAKIPIISGMNQLGGAFLGCAEGVFYVWLIMIVLTLMPAAWFSQAALSQIGDSSLLSFIYQNNLILQLLMGVFGA